MHLEYIDMVKSKVNIVMIGYQYRLALFNAVNKVNKLTNNALNFTFFNTYDVDKGKIPTDDFIRALNVADIILIDVRGGDNISKLIIDTLRNEKNKTVITLVGGSPELINLTKMGSFSLSKITSISSKPPFKWIAKKKPIDYGKVVKMRERFEKLGFKFSFGIFKHARNYALILKCYENPTEDNLTAMLLLLMKEYGNIKLKVKIPEIKVKPDMGIEDFHNNRIFNSLDEYLKSYKFRDRPLVGILFYGGHHYDQSLPAAKLLTYELEKLGLGVIPVFCSDLRYYLAIEKFFLKNNVAVIDVLIDLLWFRFAGGPIGGNHKITLDVLSKLNVPVLHGIQLSSMSIDEWINSQMGIPPIEMVTTVILPELDGRIEHYVTHCPRPHKYNGVELEEYIAIRDRVKRLALKAFRWVNLRRKPNSDKRIAIILYNYPPGEENLGKTAYLNVFKSLSNLLIKLKEHGYKIDYVPSGDELKNMFLVNGVVNSGNWVLTPNVMQKMNKVNLDEYLRWFNDLPIQVRDKVVNEWGEPPGNIMVYENSILIPGVVIGNVFIGIQPSRGVHEDPSKIYHKKDLPPHHQYIAFYKWIRDVFKADALIHFGTHGTLEFLPGKDAGLSNTCFPDILIGDLPNIYIYHVVNSSEAAIAKHRSYAVIIGHASPPIMVSETHDFILEIERLLNQYYDVLKYSKSDADKLREKIVKISSKYGLGDEVDKIHDKIYEYKRSLIPKGLHVLGRRLSDDELIDYLTFIARYDRGNVKSIHRIISEAMGLNYDELIDYPHKVTRNGIRYSDILNNIENLVRKIIKSHLFYGESIENIINNLSIKNINLDKLSLSLNYLKNIQENVRESSEIESILRALDGKYILPGPGGDPIRTPDIYPVGRNVYQLDPTNIPTELAMERGARIADEYINRYYRKYGKYPRVVSVVLWAFETMKTGGETIAAIFRLLGVKPIWKSIYIRDLEVIPLKELGRPRIDVLVTICGIFRDTFYNIVELLDKAFKLVANLDEPPEWNYVRANVLSESGKLNKEAGYRIFGPPEGEYATPLTNMIESSAWSSEADLIKAYLDSMRYAYGSDIRGFNAEKIFNKLLSKVDIVAQVRDSIDYEITDLDHYYEFLGGLAKSVENAKGEKPLILIADTTLERIKVEHIRDAIHRGVITRVLNPKWIDEMLKHGYNGATKIADRIEYLLGLAATVGYIDNWIWDKAAEKIVLDNKVSSVIQKINPWALQKIIKRLLEANERGYWHADENILEKLRMKYLETEGILEENIR